MAVVLVTFVRASQLSVKKSRFRAACIALCPYRLSLGDFSIFRFSGCFSFTFATLQEGLGTSDHNQLCCSYEYEIVYHVWCRGRILYSTSVTAVVQHGRRNSHLKTFWRTIRNNALIRTIIYGVPPAREVVLEILAYTDSSYDTRTF